MAAGCLVRSVAAHGRRARPCGARSHEKGEATTLMGGPGALCRVLNRFKPSKSIQTRSNLF
jgi:3-methyladenine DNA glycosylase Mpg